MFIPGTGLAKENTGNTLWVDAVHGGDASALPDRADKPYLTLAAAKAAAASGDLIQVRPGTYTVTASIAADGMNWDADAGVAVSRTDSASGSGSGIFDDGGAAMTFAVAGAGEIVRTTTASAGHTAGVFASHADTEVSVRCQSITVDSTHPSGNVSAAFGQAGRMYVEADFLGAESTGGGQVTTCWWTNGDMHVRAGRIAAVGATGVEAAVYSDCDVAPTGEFFVTADEILGFYGVYVTGTNTTAAVWVRALVIRATSAGGNSVLATGGNRIYVEAQKLFGYFLWAAGANLVYIRTQKWSAIGNGSGSGALIEVSSGNTGRAIIDVQDADPAGFTGHMIRVASGTVEVRGMTYTANSGSNGISVSGGTLRLIDCHIDTSANALTNPIVKSGGTLELVNCTLIAEGTRNAIEASSAQSVAVEGVLNVNRPLHANVTTTGGPVVRTDTGALTATGTMTVRQSGGTAGTDEVVISHDGTAATIRNRDTGGLRVRNAADTVTTLAVSDAGTVTAARHLIADAAPSTTSDPATVGFAGFAAGTATRFEFGNVANCLQVAHGFSVQLVSFGSIVLRGGRNDGAAAAFELINGYNTLVAGTLASRTVLGVRAAAGQTSNLQQWESVSGTVYGTVSENGYFTIRKTSAPADAELSASELAFWFDDTAGAAKLMIKAKDAGGTVRTGEVALT